MHKNTEVNMLKEKMNCKSGGGGRREGKGGVAGMKEGGRLEKWVLGVRRIMEEGEGDGK